MILAFCGSFSSELAHELVSAAAPALSGAIKVGRPQKELPTGKPVEPEITHAELEASHAAADDLFCEVLDRADRMEETRADVDATGVLYGVWSQLTVLLAAVGWTASELAEEAAKIAGRERAS
jgi:hypothetical protein